jgi:hypothetical protein
MFLTQRDIQGRGDVFGNYGTPARCAPALTQLEPRLSGAPGFGFTAAFGFPAARGAGRRVRTDDLLITNQLLYQLSYTGIAPALF